MPHTLAADIVVVGSGIMGLSIAREAVARGYRCALIDEPEIGRYASTRNQGWMQSGALDALYGISRLARDCHDGGNWLRRLAAARAGNLVRETPGFIFLQRDAQVTRILTWCEQNGVPAEVVDWRSQSDIEIDEELQFAVQVPESIMNSTAILEQLAAELNGHVFWVPMDSIGGLNLVRDGGRWQITTGGIAVEGRGLILACGSHIPAILNSIGVRPPSQVTIENIPVVVLHQSLTLELMATPMMASGPHLVPTFDQGLPRSTVILTRLLAEDGPVRASTLVEQQHVSDAVLEAIVASLLDSYPGLAKRIRAYQPLSMHGYICQRLSNNRSTDPIIRGNVRLGAEGYPPLVATYPGRFTAAPVRATEVLDTLLQAGELTRSGAGPEAMIQAAPVASRQPYFEPPTHRLSVSDVGTPQIDRIVE